MSPYRDPARIAANAIAALKIDASAPAAQILGGIAAELSRWQGYGLTPARGCGLSEQALGDANVWVEYEADAGEPQTWDHPGCPASLIVTGVLINGSMCSVEDCVPAAVIERWETAIAEEIQSAREDYKERNLPEAWEAA